MADALLEGWDGESLVVRRDEATGAWIVIAIHSTRLGPAAGGTRMKPYPDLDAAVRDALRLSEAMTLKFAAPALPFGGGKGVLMVPDGLEPAQRAALLRRYGELVHSLGGEFFTGPDVGTTPEDMDVIAETGAPYVFCRTPAAGGAGDPGPYTALGVLSAIETVCDRRFGDRSLAGRRVVVQGAGDVGGALLRLLTDAKAEVAFSDIDDDRVRRFREELGVTAVPPAEALTTPCDVLAPCALGGVLDAETIPRLRCAAVAGSANNQLAADGDAERLAARGILYAPDFVANVGGAMAMPGIEALGWSVDEARQDVVDYVHGALTKIFDVADAEGITTDAAARRLAAEHLAAAGGG